MNATRRRILWIATIRRNAALCARLPSRSRTTTTSVPSSMALLLSQKSKRFYSVSTILFDDLPYHLVVGLPALSPTMSSGSLAEWYLQEGDSFAAGDAIARLETDKASIDFEAQDDGYVAKILVQAGQGNDIPVGTPIMVTVEDAGDVAAFKDFKAQEPSSSSAAATSPVAEQKAAPVESATRSAKAASALQPPSKSVPAPAPPAAAAVAVAAPSPPPAATVAHSPSSFSTAWGLSVVNTSPLAKSLAASQKLYIHLYGTTGQAPIVP